MKTSRILCIITCVLAVRVDSFNTVDNCGGQVCATGQICRGSGESYVCSEDYCTAAGSPCQNEGSCENQENGYMCNCAAGYEGNHCQTNIDDCDPNNCLNGGTCVDGVNSYSCECVQSVGVEAYTGTHCETFDNCGMVYSPCAYLTPCTTTAEGYTCDCTGSGYTGDTCSEPIDDCPNPDPCQNGASCVDGVNYYHCSCPDGYGGLHCDTEIDECLVPPCVNGTCENLPGSYRCDCNEGWQGTDCDEMDLDECIDEPCQYGGTCTDGYNTYACECIENFNGDSCEFAPNDINYWTEETEGCNCTDIDTLGEGDIEPSSCACCRENGCQCPTLIAPDQCVFCTVDPALTEDWCNNVVIVNYTDPVVTTEAVTMDDVTEVTEAVTEADKKDKKAEPWHEKYRIYLYVVGGVLLLLAVFGLCILLTRKRKKKPPKEEPRKVEIDDEEEYYGKRNRQFTTHGEKSSTFDEFRPSTSSTPQNPTPLSTRPVNSSPLNPSPLITSPLNPSPLITSSLNPSPLNPSPLNPSPNGGFHNKLYGNKEAERVHWENADDRFRHYDVPNIWENADDRWRNYDMPNVH